MMDKKSQHRSRSKSKRVRKKVSAIVLFAFTLMLFTFTASLVSADTVTYEYDDAGRLIKVDYGDGTAIEYSYDSAGNLLTREIIKVIKGVPISGLTGEVNCSIEPDVTVILYNKTTGNKIAETTSDTNGNYTITAPCSGDYKVTASKAGFKNVTREIGITEGVTSFNFRGEHGLTPEDPTMGYALECVNHWLYPSGECGLTMAKALEVVNAWLY